LFIPQIVKTEGVAALYCGLVPSVAAIIPEAAITYGMFDILKKSYSQMRGVPEPSVFVSLAFGVSSAFMGQVVAYPLETVSRRMQVRAASQAAVHLRSYWTFIYSHEIFVGLPCPNDMLVYNCS
jgi:ABC-type Fe3+ transport system permease subunit